MIDLGLEIGDLGRIEVQYLGKYADGVIGIAHAFRDDVHAKVGTIGRERRSVAIEDPATTRRDQ